VQKENADINAAFTATLTVTQLARNVQPEITAPEKIKRPFIYLCK